MGGGGKRLYASTVMENFPRVWGCSIMHRGLIVQLWNITFNLILIAKGLPPSAKVGYQALEQASST